MNAAVTHFIRITNNNNHSYYGFLHPTNTNNILMNLIFKYLKKKGVLNMF